MLIIPVIISLIVYHISFKLVESETVNSNIYFNRLVKKEIDNKLSNIVSISNRICSNKSVVEFSYLNTELNNSHRLGIIKIAEDLSLFMASEDYIKNIYLYYENLNLVVSYGQTFTENEFYNEFRYFENQTLSNWKESFSLKKYGRFIPAYLRNSYNFSAQYAYLKKVNRCIAIIVIDIDRLTNNLNNINDIENFKFLIKDSQNNIVTTIGEFDNNIELSKDFNGQNEGVSKLKINDLKYISVYDKSSVSDWHYINVISDKQFWYKVRHIKYIATAFSMISVLSGLFLALILVRKNYKPVFKIMEYISKKEGKPDDVTNEFKFIEDKVVKKYMDYQSLNIKLENQNKIAESSAITKLLKESAFNIEYLTSLLELSNITFESNYFCVVIFTVINKENVLQNSLNQAYQYLLDQITKRIKYNTGLYRFSKYVVEVDGNIACLINFNKDLHEGHYEITVDFCDKICNMLRENYFVEVVACIGSIADNISRVNGSYFTALLTSEYKIVEYPKTIISYGEIYQNLVHDEPIDFNYSANTQQKFLNCIRCGDYEACCEILDNVFGKSNETEMSLSTIKVITLNLYLTILKAARECAIIHSDLNINNDPAKFVCDSFCIQDLVLKFKKIIYIICKNRNVGEKDYNKLFFENVIEYINVNYFDPNLNVSTLSERFKMTRSYFSKRFKEEAGEGLLDYIHRLRIGKAKLYFNEGCSISEASLKIGYNDIGTFIRLFKKYEGITPGKYKEVIQKS